MQEEIKLTQNDIRAIEDILSKGRDAEVRKRPSTGEVLIFEIEKRIKSGK